MAEGASEVMNPSYFRIRLSLAAAMTRFAVWCKKPELEPPQLVKLHDAVQLACDASGHWRGSALYVFENAGWTIFDDQSGHHSAIPAEAWQDFAQGNEFVFAGYNDAIGYGELIVIENGQILREFLFDAENPEANRNLGRLEGSKYEPIKTWIQVARFVDDDELAFSETGLLWMH